MRVVGKLIALALGLWLVASALIGVAFAAAKSQPRGQMIDLGGRHLRLICEGTGSADRPVVWMEAGANGGAADFGAVQRKLAALGLRSCAYDRAGLGQSDPGPLPRDSEAVARDLEALMYRSGQAGPVVLVGHSMAGLHMRVFAARSPERVAGLVLVDAMTPEQFDDPKVQKLAGLFATISRLNSALTGVGLTFPFIFVADRIGLPAEAHAEKRRSFVSRTHALNAMRELAVWRASVAQARLSAPFNRAWPVAVVTAGGQASRDDRFQAARLSPAQASRAGWATQDLTATHASILGEAHAEFVVEGVRHVLEALEKEKGGGRAAGKSSAP